MTTHRTSENCAYPNDHEGEHDHDACEDANRELCLGCLHRSMAQIEHTCDYDLYNE